MSIILQSSSVEAWLKALLSGIVANGDAIEIQTESSSEGLRIAFNVTIAPADFGKVIGKKGRIAHALRTLLNARGGRDRLIYSLDITAPEPEPCGDRGRAAALEAHDAMPRE